MIRKALKGLLIDPLIDIVEEYLPTITFTRDWPNHDDVVYTSKFKISNWDWDEDALILDTWTDRHQWNNKWMADGDVYFPDGSWDVRLDVLPMELAARGITKGRLEFKLRIHSFECFINNHKITIPFTFHHE
jgi:hypothetical protein